MRRRRVWRLKMNRSTLSPTIRTIDLEHEQMLVIDNRPGTRVRVLHGGVWLTEQGELDDQFARAGDELRLAAPGRAVLEGIGCSRIEVAPAPRRWAAALREAIAAVRRAAAAWPAQGAALVLSLALGVGVPEMLARGMQHSGLAPGSVAAARA
jgi:Protein of unknown function (DUF2917)